MSNRRRFLTLGALGGLLGAVGCAVQSNTGGRNPYYSGPVSDHFDGTRFFNPAGQTPRGFGDVIRWQLQGGKAEWPDAVPVAQRRPAPQVDDLRVTMVGHATLLIQVAGRNILTDPVWSLRASPSQLFGPARVTAPGIAFDALPRIHAVLLSHNHYDHFDLETLARLHARHGMPVLTPLGNDTILRQRIEGIDARAGDWGDTFDLDDIAIRLTPCHHWSARGTRDRSMALWSAFLMDTPAGRVWFVGDTGYDEGRPYRDLPDDIRLAILPIGAYAPRWFMKPQHQNPEEAVAGFRTCGARHAIATHWGTFQLTNEPREEPPAKLAEALDAQGIDPARFAVLDPGAHWDIPA